MAGGNMNYHVAKLIGLAVTVLALIGCRIEITSPENGRVTTTSGAYNCNPSRYDWSCFIEINDLYFEEEFIAIPDPGYVFAGWKKKDKGLCGGKTTSCKIVSGLAEDNEVLMVLLESNETFYLEAVFENASACGGTDSGKSEEITLRQGESAIREVKLKRDRQGSTDKTRLVGCPQGVCSADFDRWNTKYAWKNLTFTTTPETPLGTYKVQYQTYKGGSSCDFLFGCRNTAVKIKKNWQFKLKVVECPM
jgi:hypothetical protein